MARPREFDSADVLGKIMEVFWTKGFEAASLEDLVAATGLLRGSLYAAFGDKQAMYRQALTLYEQLQVEDAVSRLQDMDGKDGTTVIGHFLDAVVDAVREGAGPRGCFLCNASIDRTLIDAQTKAIVDAAHARLQQALEQALGQVDRYADDPATRQAAARALLALYFGMQVLARNGAGVEDLIALRRAATAWI